MTLQLLSLVPCLFQCNMTLQHCNMTFSLQHDTATSLSCAMSFSAQLCNVVSWKIASFAMSFICHDKLCIYMLYICIYINIDLDIDNEYMYIYIYMRICVYIYKCHFFCDLFCHACSAPSFRVIFVLSMCMISYPHVLNYLEMQLSL